VLVIVYNLLIISTVLAKMTKLKKNAEYYDQIEHKKNIMTKLKEKKMNKY